MKKQLNLYDSNSVRTNMLSITNGPLDLYNDVISLACISFFTWRPNLLYLEDIKFMNLRQDLPLFAAVEGAFMTHAANISFFLDSFMEFCNVIYIVFAYDTNCNSSSSEKHLGI